MKELNGYHAVNKKREEDTQRMIDNGIFIPREELPIFKSVAQDFKVGTKRGVALEELGDTLVNGTKTFNSENIGIRIGIQTFQEWSSFWRKVAIKKKEKNKAK